MPRIKAQVTVVDGIEFKSKTEARRYGELKLLQAAGEISMLRYEAMQLDVNINNVKVMHYTPDFTYLQDGQTVVEETKGHPTPAFNVRWKCVRAAYPDIKFIYLEYAWGKLVKKTINGKVVLKAKSKRKNRRRK